MHEKRSELMTLRMTPGDLAQFMRAAERLWPGAPLNKSAIVLGLARLQAEQVLSATKKADKALKS